MNSKILSIDYGIKRTGLAVTDPLQIIALSLTTIKTKNLMYFLHSYIYEENIQRVIIGDQKNYNYLPSIIEKEIQYFIKKFCLSFPNIHIDFINESYTSNLARKILIEQKKKNRINKSFLDKISATIILQSYLNKKKMILPIRLYGDSILRIKCKDIDVSKYRISQFITDIISDMFDTMYKASGIGLSAPQVGNNLRIFVIDISTFKIYNEEKPYKQVFINPKIIKIYGKAWKLKEGCLSIPHIVAKIERYEYIKIRYYNEKIEKCEETFQGFKARVIQHEYDHIEGKLFIDYINRKFNTKLS